MKDDLGPRLAVLAATTSERFAESPRSSTPLAGRAPLALAGAVATKNLAQNIGARLLTWDPVTAAEHVASS